MTPALERAAEAIEALWPETPWPGVRELPTPEDEARAALSAALTDDDDPDWLARVLFLVDRPDMAELWDAQPHVEPSPWHHQADAVRAAILGESA